jgi:CelD/BcsL family acetyltransferase involved in cellulose biosynthesis
MAKDVSSSWEIHPVTKFGEQSENWDRLNHKGPQSPLMTAMFLRPLLKEFGTGREILAVCGRPDPVAMAILRRRSQVGWETFQPSQAPLGAWLQIPELDTEKLARSLIKALPGFGLSLGITQLDPELVTRPKDSAALQTLDYIQTARISIRGSFEEYWAQRGKNLRHNLKRQRNQLAKQAVECHVDVVTSPSEVGAAVADYSKMETAGWKAGTGTAVRSDDAQGRFYTQLLQDHCTQGQGRIYRFWLGGRVAAADLCVDDGVTFVILKTSYDEAITNLSPALLMREEYFRELFGTGIRRIEFYGRVMDWHTKWSDETRTMYHINCYRSPLIATLQRSARNFRERKRTDQPTAVPLSASPGLD